MIIASLLILFSLANAKETILIEFDGSNQNHTLEPIVTRGGTFSRNNDFYELRNSDYGSNTSHFHPMDRDVGSATFAEVSSDMFHRITASMRGKCQITGTFPNPFHVHPNDPRLASCAFLVNDAVTGILLGFVVTNDKVFVLYQRLPTQRTFSNFYAVFAYLIPVKDRIDSSEMIDFALDIDNCNGSVMFKVDGRSVFYLSKLGYRLPEIASDYKVFEWSGFNSRVYPRLLRFGVANIFSHDFYTACQQTIINGLIRRCPPPAQDEALLQIAFDAPSPRPFHYQSSYQQDSLRNLFFGQGAIFSIGKLNITGHIDAIPCNIL